MSSYLAGFKPFRVCSAGFWLFFAGITAATAQENISADTIRVGMGASPGAGQERDLQKQALLEGFSSAMRQQGSLSVVDTGGKAPSAGEAPDFTLDSVMLDFGGKRFFQLKVFEGSSGTLLKSFLVDLADSDEGNRAAGKKLASRATAFLSAYAGQTGSSAKSGGEVRVANLVDQDGFKVLPEVPAGFYRLLGKMRTPVPLFSCRVRNPYPTPVEARLSASFNENLSNAAFSGTETLSPGEVRDLCRGIYPDLPQLGATVEEKGVAAVIRVSVSARRQKSGVWQTADFQLPTIVKPPEVMIWEMPDPFSEKGEAFDFREGLAAWVEIKGTEIDELWLKILKNHPGQRLAGYLDRASTKIGALEDSARRNQREAVRADVKAIYDTLQKEFNLPYSDISVSFSRFASQNIAYPATVIRRKTGNCIDFSLLFASLLLRDGLDPFLIIKPGHAFVGWAIAPGGSEMEAIEATMINPEKGFSFDAAYNAGMAEIKTPIKDMYETASCREFPYKIDFKRVFQRLGLQPSENK